MSRTTECDGCRKGIEWVEGTKDPSGEHYPPLTMRGPGLALDFHDMECVFSFAQRFRHCRSPQALSRALAAERLAGLSATPRSAPPPPS